MERTTHTFTRDGETVRIWIAVPYARPFFVQVGDGLPQDFVSDAARAAYLDWRFELAQDVINWDGAPDKPADFAASKRAGAIVAQINRGGATGASLHAKLFGEILSKESE